MKHGRNALLGPRIMPLLIFDLDGTLVDTNRDLIPALNHAIAPEGVEPVALEEVGHVVGQGARQMIERAFELRGRAVPRERMDALHAAFLQRYEAHIADESRPYPGLLEALEGLAGEDWRFAVCTNKAERLARKLLFELDMARLFTTVTGGDTFAHRKPDPRHLTDTVALAGGGEAIMVGDSINDIAAAQAVPMPVVAVDFGYTDTPVTELGPDLVISHYGELPEAVRALDPRRNAPV